MTNAGERWEQCAPLPREFYAGPPDEAARRLLGCTLVRRSDTGVTAGRITETEAYSQDDPASHSFRGRSARTAVMFGPPGFAYVYFTYGMHYCFNAVVGEEGRGEAVLIRAVEPLVGLDEMRARRGQPDAPAALLCAGPARLCSAFGIGPELNREDLCTGETLWLCSGDIPDPARIVASPRIGITRAMDLLWRFTIRGDAFTSRPRQDLLA